MDFTQLILYFKEVLDNVVIKYDYQAKQLDTLEMKTSFQRYKICYTKTDTFYSHNNYPRDVLISAGITDEELLAECVKTREAIPSSYRDKVLDGFRKYVVSSYEEKNNYYRKLIGLPNYGETEENFFYVPSDIAEEYDISEDIPIHLLDNNSILILKDTGFINELIENNPDAEYLKYIGLDKMNLIEIREARNYELLKMPTTLSETFYKSFVETYSAARDYILTVFYVNEYNSSYPRYDEFIGLCIMTACLLRVSTKLVDSLIQRDFFDIKTIIMFFEAYGIPFVDSLNFQYQQLLARNVNYLLRYKSTDLALQEVTKILGFSSSQLTKFYIVKEHKLDDNENPVFYYKTKLDEKGNPILDENENPIKELDYEKTFDVYFQEVSLDETNIQMALKDSGRKIDYNQMIMSDPFWVDDDELREFLLKENFNYEETKYIGVSITYRMTEMLFEMTTIFRMIGDNKNTNTKNVMIDMGSISSEKVSLFDAFVLLFALLAKRNNMKGNISSTPTKVSSVVGFNFYADFKKIRNDIIKTCEKREDLLSESDKLKLFDFLSNLNVTSISDINRLFTNIKNLNVFLMEKMNNSNSIEEFDIYRKLYDTLMIVDNVTDMFTMSDGTVAETYSDYLKSENYNLYLYLEETESSNITSGINYITGKVESACENVKYLYSITNDSDNISKALKKFINFFKSYTTDLISMNTTYLLNSRFENYLRTLHDIKGISKTLELNDYSLKMNYSDTIKSCKTIEVNDSLEFRHSVRIIRN